LIYKEEKGWSQIRKLKVYGKVLNKNKKKEKKDQHKKRKKKATTVRRMKVQRQKCT